MQPYRTLTDRAQAILGERAAALTVGRDYLAKAVQYIEEGRVSRDAQDPTTWHVISISTETKRRRGDDRVVTGDHCAFCVKAGLAKGTKGYTCPHVVAVKLAGWTEEACAREQVAMYAEDHSEDGHKTAQDAPGLMQTAPQVSEDLEDQKCILDDPDANITVPQIYTGLPEALPVMPSDLTPVALPGGGERTRSMGHLLGALARAQQRMKNPPFDKQGQVGNLKTRFASTPALRNVIIAELANEGVAVMQYVYETERGMRCMTTLGHGSGEYVCVPLDVPHSGTTLTERGKTVGFAKRWALQTAVVLFGEDEAEGMEALPSDRERRTEAVRPGQPVPDMTTSTPTDVARTYLPQLQAAITAVGGNVERWLERGEAKFGTKRSAWSAAQYEYLLREARQAKRKEPAATTPEG